MASSHLLQHGPLQAWRTLYRIQLVATNTRCPGCVAAKAYTYQYRSFCTYTYVKNNFLKTSRTFYETRKCRYSSQDDHLKNDPMVKSWLSEMKKDFEKEQKSRSIVSNETTDQGKDNELENVEKHGFTVEEYLAHLKECNNMSNSSELEHDSNEHSDSDSGFETENKDTDSDCSTTDPDKDTEKASESNIKTTDNSSAPLKPNDQSLNAESKTNLNKLDDEDWSVVVLDSNYDTDVDDYKDISNDTGIIADFGTVATSNGAFSEVTSRETKKSGQSDSTPREWSEMEIEDFVNIAAQTPVVESEWEPPISLERGKTGVFDVEELVTLLRSQNARDVATIHMPKYHPFVEYMVIVTAMSRRHLTVMAEDVKWTYKRKRGANDSDTVKLEGQNTDWCAVDLGNIVLHLFLHETRQLYDLETLWTVGAELDPKMRDEDDPYVFKEEELPWLQELEKKHKDRNSE